MFLYFILFLTNFYSLLATLHATTTMYDSTAVPVEQGSEPDRGSKKVLIVNHVF
jgi:hypothetical protein